MATSIALINMKGGVGKTTLSVNLAWHLCRGGGYKVLLIDLDPQFNASQYVMSYDEWDKQRKHPKGTIADLLIEPVKETMPLRKKLIKKKSSRVKKCIFSREKGGNGGVFDLLPSELELSRAIKNPDRVAYKLEKIRQEIDNDYDFIIIDCAPTDSVLTDTALMASDYVLVPIKPDRFSVLGYAQIQQTLSLFRDAYPNPHSVKDLGVVFTQVVGGSDIEDSCIADVTEQADYVFRTTLKKSNSYLRSIQDQTPVFDTRYARSITVASIRNLAKEISERINELKVEKEQ